jgi:hypothetical protein
MPDDAIHPGATAFTRTGAHSSAAVSVKLSMPARAAPECPIIGMPVPHVGDHVHDRAAVGLHPLRVGFACHQKSAGQIGAHDCVPALGGDLLQRRRELPARIVDDKIEPSEIGERRAR